MLTFDCNSSSGESDLSNEMCNEESVGNLTVESTAWGFITCSTDDGTD